MHAKPDLRVFLKWLIYRSGSVITAVIRFMFSLVWAFHKLLDKINLHPTKGLGLRKFSLKTFLLLSSITSLAIGLIYMKHFAPPISFDVPVKSGNYRADYERSFGIKSPVVPSKIWRIGSPNPPLSAQQAIALSTPHLPNLENPELHWELQSVSLIPADPKKGHWYWIVTYMSKYDHGDHSFQRGGESFVVEMDGNVAGTTLELGD